MRAERQAKWCLLTGQSVDTYLTLTRVERDEFTKAASQRRR